MSDAGSSRRCWCGGGLEPFGAGYLACPSCGTLAPERLPDGDVRAVRVRSDGREEGLYGRSYWFERQRARDAPDLEERSRLDLGERCAYWLDTVSGLRPPPARALEIGCAHGGFVALLDAAGYEATGLELSPWVVAHARRIFGVDVRSGAVEAQEWPSGSFDLIFLMDVLEHLPEPATTLRRCAELLGPAGLLVIQTPERPEGLDLARLRSGGDRFLEMLLPDEHLHLFTRAGVAVLCRDVGLGEIRFLDPLFPYDMFLVAGRAVPTPGEGRLGSGRWLVEALLDTARQRRELESAYARADTDRRDRADQLARLEEEYRQADRDRRDRTDQLEGLDAEYRRADQDRRDRAEQVERLEAQYLQADRDRQDRAEQVERLEEQYLQADRDRRDRAEQVDRMHRELERLEEARAQTEAARAESAARLEELTGAVEEHARERLEAERALAAERRDRATREAALERRLDAFERRRATAIERAATSRAERTELRRRFDEAAGQLERESAARRELELQLQEERDRRQRAAGTMGAFAGRVGDLETARERAETLAARWREHGRRLREVWAEHRSSRIYRLLVRLGRWRAHDRYLEAVLAATAAAGEPATDPTVFHPAPSPRGPIAVDLTALLPDGRNGGAKRAALALVRAFAALRPDERLVLLTSAPCHDELAAFEASCPSVVRRLVRPDHAEDLARCVDEDAPSVLWCPTTVPPFADPRLPTVCLVNDLQYRDYPQFFPPAERASRQADVERAAATADAVITISEFVRGTLLEATGIDATKVTAILHGLLEPPAGGDGTAEDARADQDRLAALGLEAESYLLYPANFWPHKNHRMLLTAHALLLRRRQDAPTLVLTGAEHPDRDFLRAAASRLGLADRVLFPGYVDDATLRALLAGCRALVFPSLYEGFGLPVLEAMAAGRPVIAAATTAIPEVAGDAALLVDPRRPEPLVAAVERLLDDPTLEADLVARGRRRAAELGDVRKTARRHLAVLDRVADQGPRPVLHGVHADGWSTPRWGVTWGRGEAGRTLHVVVSAPPVPGGAVLVVSDGSATHRVRRPPGRSASLTCPLPPEPGALRFDCEPPWVPDGIGLNQDSRRLGWKLESCLLRDPSGAADDLLAGAGVAAGRGPVRIAVVTPSFQQGRFVERTLASVLTQHVPGEIEVDHYVADGGSRDGTREILERSDDRVRWCSEPDLGQADAVNKALERTSAEIVGWLNSDDVYLPGALAAVARFFAENPEVDVVYGDAVHLDEADRVLEPYPTEDFDRERLQEVCFICQPACFFRRRAVARWGPLDASLRYCMDYELWLRWARGGARFARLPVRLAGSRLYATTKTLGQRKAVHREINDMLRRTLGRVPERWISNWAHARLEPTGLSYERSPRRFTVAVAALSWAGALWWNRRISRSLARTTWQWIRANVLGRPP